MAALTEWKVPPSAQPRAEDYSYDLERALSSVVGLHSIIPPDAFTAETLGVERAGNGVLIDDGLVLTIGYLITEAETVWLHLGDGRVMEGHALGSTRRPASGWCRRSARIDLPALPLGSSAAAEIGERVVIGGAGGRTRSLAGRIAAKQEFAGYWEYVLDEAIFTSPAHPNWGGTALISPQGELIGIGSLAARARARGQERASQHDRADRSAASRSSTTCANSAASTSRRGRGSGSIRPRSRTRSWSVGIAPKGPAARAELKTGDVMLAVNGEKVSTLAGFYRKVWALGQAGVEVPLTLYREGVTFDVRVNSSDRAKFLKAPRMH